MARRRDEDEEQPQDDEYEGFVRGTVKRLFETSVAAPNAARSYIVEQFSGWKSDFLGIFQSEIRRFFDRLHPAEEAKKLLSGRRLEFTISFRRRPDDGKPKADEGESGKPRKKK